MTPAQLGEQIGRAAHLVEGKDRHAEMGRVAMAYAAGLVREARVEGMKTALHDVEELYFTADNDIEEAQCDGITKAREAIQALITAAENQGGKDVAGN